MPFKLYFWVVFILSSSNLMLDKFKGFKVCRNILEILPLKILDIKIYFKFHILKIIYLNSEFDELFLPLFIKVKASWDKIGSTIGRKLVFNVLTSLQFKSNFFVVYSHYFRCNKLAILT